MNTGYPGTRVPGIPGSRKDSGAPCAAGHQFFCFFKRALILQLFAIQQVHVLVEVIRGPGDPGTHPGHLGSVTVSDQGCARVPDLEARTSRA